MAIANQFPVQSRADGSIDTDFYTNRASRLHTASFAEAANRLKASFLSVYSAMSKTRSPSAPASIISTRRAPSAL